MLGLRCYRGFSLVAAIGAYSLAAAHRLLLAVASLVGEHQLEGMRASAVTALGLSSYGSQALWRLALQISASTSLSPEGLPQT